MTHLDLFSGIGGFALAADRVWPDIQHVFCEIDPFCQEILKKHWPQSYIYEDIRTLTNATDAGAEGVRRERQDEVFLLTGGFPCQPFSHAGKRKGTSDDRHLWPEMRRVIQEFTPRYVVAENVRGLLSIEGGMVFEQVCLDLEALGYEVQPFIIPACAVNAPHRRDRIWIVANAEHKPARNAERAGADERSSTRVAGSSQNVANAKSGWERSSKPTGDRSGESEEKTGNRDWLEPWPQVATRLCRLDDGLSEGVSRPRGWRNAALKAYGNAIVPQVAIEIFQALKVWKTVN